MSFANPTSLRIGMTATLAGRPYRVAGRVVMGETEGGETYYWNEFNLETDDGHNADLVYEETEHGGQWRIFTMFEPEYPMTAADAAAKRISDHINLTGEDLTVTLRSKSRVYHIEGEAPEGVEIGDVANYFNAEAGDKMAVVSWTGEELEYYNGEDLPHDAVASAFNLSREAVFENSAGSFSEEPDGYHYDSSSKFFVKMAVLVIGVAIFYFIYSSHDPRVQPAVTKMPASAAPLPLEGSGKLEGRNYHITGHSVVEIAEVGQIFDRHEYQLLDDDGKPALLVCGWNPNSPDWVLYAPIDPLTPLTPPQAGTKKLGEVVNVDGLDASISELFLSTVEQSNPGYPPPPTLKKGEMFFGFNARSSSTLLLACWNNENITYQRGKILPAKDVTAAFNPPSGQ